MSDNIDKILAQNEENKKKQDQQSQDLKQTQPANVLPIKKRTIGEVIRIDRILYRVRKITKKDIILRQLTPQETVDFNKKFEEHQKQLWKQMWADKIQKNSNTVYKNPEDKSPDGGHWYCEKHFEEKYSFKPRMYTDVYNLKDVCAKCSTISGPAPKPIQELLDVHKSVKNKVIEITKHKGE